MNHILATAELPPDLKQGASEMQTCQELISYFDRLDDRPPSAEALLTEMQAQYKSSVDSMIISQYLVKFVPRFVYFNDYSTMRGSISIQDLQKRSANGNLSDADRTFLSLLSLVGADLEDLKNEQNYERMKAELEAASISITDEVFEFWSQNKQLDVEFDLSTADPNAEPPLNSGTILHVRIKNNHHRVSVPFDERSRGFVWFFSFLAYFSQLEEEENNLILLLDEPGLSLHAKAQYDFLRFINERLARKYQVIYTTHSPFMIDPSQLHNVRMVQDVDGQGTVVSQDVLRNDRDTVFPLQAALGYELAQTLFVGPHCLLVEGPSDLIYLQVLSEAMVPKGKSQLDSRWVVVPVGGADKVSTFVSLLGANQLDIAVLMDVSSRDRQRIENLCANAFLAKSNLVQISEFTGKADADIEDLFSLDFYLQLVNGAYADQLPNKITPKMLTVGDPRITNRISAYFASEGTAGGRFNHYKPAAFLMQQQGKLIGKLDDVTIERAAQLFERVNSLLPPRLT